MDRDSTWGLRTLRPELPVGHILRSLPPQDACIKNCWEEILFLSSKNFLRVFIEGIWSLGGWEEHKYMEMVRRGFQTGKLWAFNLEPGLVWHFKAAASRWCWIYLQISGYVSRWLESPPGLALSASSCLLDCSVVLVTASAVAVCLVPDDICFFSFYLSLNAMCLEQQGCFRVWPHRSLLIRSHGIRLWGTIKSGQNGKGWRGVRCPRGLWKLRIIQGDTTNKGSSVSTAGSQQ